MLLYLLLFVFYKINHHANGKIVSSLICFDSAAVAFSVTPMVDADDEDDVIETTSSVFTYIWKGLFNTISALAARFTRKSEEDISDKTVRIYSY